MSIERTASTASTAGSEESALGLLRLFAGMWVVRAIHVAARLGIADLIADDARPVADLAVRSGSDAGSLHRLLRALSTIGVFTETQPGWFRNSSLSLPLRSDAADSLLPFALWSADWQWRSLDQLEYSVRTGRPAFDRVYGCGYWEYLSTVNPEAGRLFDEGMAHLSAMTNAAIAAAYDFSATPTVVDVGGGEGGLLIAILQAHASARGLLVDLPETVRRAESRIDRAGLGERCRAVAGDFFHDLPDAADAYLLQRILHDWDDARCLAILRACRRAMRTSGRVLVIENVIRPGSPDSGAAFLDVDMMISTGGRERSVAEFGDLFDDAGLRLGRVVETGTSCSILEGLPV